MRLILILACLAAFGTPATAADVTIRVEVYDDFGACAWVTSFDQGAIAGTFASAGLVAGPGTLVSPVYGATRYALAGPGAWHGCLPDAYAGATTGSATYVVTYTARDGDVVRLVECRPSAGTVSCS